MISGLRLLGGCCYIYAATHMEWVIGSFDGSTICIATKWPRPSDQNIKTNFCFGFATLYVQHFTISVKYMLILYGSRWSGLKMQKQFFLLNRIYMLISKDDIVVGIILRGDWKMELKSLNNFCLFRGSSCSGPGRGVGGWGRWCGPSTSPQPGLQPPGDQFILQLSTCSRFSTQGPSHTLKVQKGPKVQKSRR